MEPHEDEESLRALNDIDAARLALRGALATIRDLQDANVRLKGNLQESAAKERLSATQNADLRKQLDEFREKMSQWERERAEEAARQMRFEDACRLKIRAEERANAEQERRGMAENLLRLTQTVEQVRESKDAQERRLAELKRLLDQRDAEVLSSQREKVEIVTRVHQDQEAVGRMRVKRDEEIQSILRAKEEALANADRELREATHKNEELQRALAAAAKDTELKLQDREEVLVRQYREKERELQERYSRREAELQAAWSELENGLWQKAKEARDKLDKAVQAQFDERARALADRTREVEELLQSRREQLEEEVRRRLTEGERALADKERMLEERHQARQEELLKHAESEIGKEKEIVQAAAREQARALEEEYREKLAAIGRRQTDLEQSFERRRQELETQAAAREGQIQILCAAKEKALEEAGQARLVELEEDYLRKESKARDEWTKRKVDLLADHQRAIESEIAAKQLELEQKGRELEDSHRARVAELERAHVGLEEQFRAWKAALQVDAVRKEKGLEQRSFLREQELLRTHEMALDQERRVARAQAQEAKEQFETMRENLQKDLLAREEAAKVAHERLETGLREAHFKREQELDQKHRVELEEAAERHRVALAQQAKHFENAALLRDEEARRRVAPLEEGRHSDRLDFERSLAAKDTQLKAVQEKLAKLEAEHHTLFEDLLARERKLETERAETERQVKQRDQERESKYLALESELQALWTEKEQSYLESHREALAQAQAQFGGALEGQEAARRAEREAHERERAALEERLQARFAEWQKQALADAAREKEEWLERQRRALAHEREMLQRQSREGSQLERAAALDEERAALELKFARRAEELEKQWKAREESVLAKAEESARAAQRELARREGQEEQTLARAERAFKDRQARLEREAAERETALREAAARREAELEKELATSQERLHAVAADSGGPSARFERELSEIVFGIAHQVRNPLGIIQSLAEERLGDFWAGRKQKESAAVMMRAVDGLKARLEQLIEFARPLGLDCAPVQPGALLERARARVARACAGQGIEVAVQAADGLGSVDADEDRLGDALVRLAENAVEAMSHGGRLTLAARAAGGSIELEVADTGRGIEREQLREAGKPFFTTKPGGLGLGLAIARRIVEGHGGTLAIESERGKGTRVVCRLPAKTG